MEEVTEANRCVVEGGGEKDTVKKKGKKRDDEEGVRGKCTRYEAIIGWRQKERGKTDGVERT